MSQFILRLPAVKARTGVSRTYISGAIAQGTVPRADALGPRAVGWLDTAIDEWIAARPVAGSAVAVPVKKSEGE